MGFSTSWTPFAHTTGNNSKHATALIYLFFFPNNILFVKYYEDHKEYTVVRIFFFSLQSNNNNNNKIIIIMKKEQNPVRMYEYSIINLIHCLYTSTTDQLYKRVSIMIFKKSHKTHSKWIKLYEVCWDFYRISNLFQGMT